MKIIKYQKINFQNYNSNLFVKKILNEKGKKSQINFVNPHTLYLSRNDYFLSESLQHAKYNLIDGVGLQSILKLKYKIKIFRNRGFDIVNIFLKKIYDSPKKILFIGSTKQNLLKVKKNKLFSNHFFFNHVPLFETITSLKTMDGILKKIEVIKPDIIFIAMSAPKQEKIASYLVKYASHKFDYIFCIGAVVDYLSRKLTTPSGFITRHGFEWLHRLVNQPSVVWKRVFITGPLFVINSIINANLKEDNFILKINNNNKLKNAKLSIITVVKNNHLGILRTLKNVEKSLSNKINLTIVDGNSNDGTTEIISEFIKKSSKKKYINFLKQKDSSVYESINLAIKLASGKYITLVHSGDFYLDINFYKIILKKINSNKDFYYSNCFYFNKYFNVKRVWFPKKILNGFADYILVPHTTVIIKKKIFDQIGKYSDKYKISSDYDFLIRLKNAKPSYQHISKNDLAMESMGLSTNPKFFFKKFKEDIKINFLHYGWTFIFYYIFKIAIKVPSFLSNYKKNYFLKLKLYINLYFKNKNIYFKHLLLNKKTINLNLIREGSRIPFYKKQFILSGLNLAFLGSFGLNDVYLNSKILYHWPDGVFFNYLINKKDKKKNSIKKISGSNLLNQLIIPSFIKKIVVIGNLNIKQKHFLAKKFKKIILHYQLGYENIHKEIFKVKKIYKNEIVILTLPSPKQENFAYELLKKNEYAKILCLGGAVNILTGLEKKVPDLLYNLNLEFLWRLKTDTIRRTKRLLITFYGFVIFYKSKIINKINIKVI